MDTQKRTYYKHLFVTSVIEYDDAKNTVNLLRAYQVLGRYGLKGIPYRNIPCIVSIIIPTLKKRSVWYCAAVLIPSAILGLGVRIR